MVGGIRPESLHAAQDEIALAIVDTLKARLLIGEREALTKRHTDDSELLRLYLLGRHHWHRFTPEDFELSEGYMEQALDKDPDFAMAHVGIAEENHVKPFFMAAAPKTVIPKAKAHVERALEIDSDLAEAHAILGRILTFYDWDWEAAELLNEVEEMAKERFVPPQFLFSMYKMKGDMDRAFRWFEKAVEERDFMLPFCLTWPGKEWQMPDEPRFHQALDRLRDPQT